uniref:carbonyl reductase (NADPH) n=1 Tax=Amphiprion percula TaxID=161767 RepID=A0A3P8SW71_AMPPE
VYLTSRDVGRGEEAVKSLSSEGLNPKFHQLDINDVSSITAAAAFFKEKYGGVDVLINNAAILFKEGDTTPFAVQADVTLKTNFFATRDMLTHFLCPVFCVSGRVVNVSSLGGSWALKDCSPALQQRFRSEDITEDELVGLMQRFVAESQKGKHKEDGWPETAYGGLIMRCHIYRNNDSKCILVNACCPGWVRTDMTSEKAPKSPDEGAITPVYLALLPPGATEPHGKFVSDKEVQPW